MPTEKKAADAAKGDVQEQVDAEQEQGFYGTKVDPIADEEYTLLTGPDSPDAVTQRKAAAKAAEEA